MRRLVPRFWREGVHYVPAPRPEPRPPPVARPPRLSSYFASTGLPVGVPISEGAIRSRSARSIGFLSRRAGNGVPDVACGTAAVCVMIGP
jgi:hypothetical protein